MIYLAVILTAIGCVWEVYYWIAFFKSEGGKYPPFIPSFGNPKKVVIDEVSRVLREASNQLVVADLGCGSGTILIELAKIFPQHHFIGIEWDAVPYFFARRRLKCCANAEIRCENFLESDLSACDIIICYIGSKLGRELGEKLNQNLKESAVVISEIFELEGLKKEHQIETSFWRKNLKVFVYRVNR